MRKSRISSKSAWEKMQEEAQTEGYQLDGYYVNSRSEFRVTCPEGHTYQIQAQTWQAGYRCAQCAAIKASQSKRLTEADAITRLESQGYQLESRYISYQGAIRVVCQKGHPWRTDLKSFTLGRRCPTCNRQNRNPGVS